MFTIFDEKGRYEELDSLRGYAALSVVLHHHLLAIPAFFSMDSRSRDHSLDWLFFAPLHTIWDGHAAVVLFFVLSGFVLSLPYHRGRFPSFPAYAVKRIARIYPPYWLVIALSIGLMFMCGGEPVEGMSGWFNRPWATPPTIRLLLEHFFLITSFQTNAFDPVLWSLVHEVRISLIFPLLMAFVLRVHWRLALSAALFTSVLGWGLSLISQDRSAASFPLTLQYSVAFVAGAVLAGHRVTVIGWYRGLPLWRRLVWAGAAILLYDYSYVVPGIPILHRGPTNDYASCIGAIMLIVLSLGSSSFSWFLRHRFSLFLGRISYSLYLVHAVVLLTIVRSFHHAAGLAILLPTSIVVSIVLSGLLAIAVETPSIFLGRYLADKVATRRPVLHSKASVQER